MINRYDLLYDSDQITNKLADDYHETSHMAFLIDEIQEKAHDREESA
jgi:hypothetical protein